MVWAAESPTWPVVPGGAMWQSSGGRRRTHPTMPIGLKCNRLEM